jgi:hypothetical protein
VRRLLAVQAQDLRSARLAIRARTAGVTAAEVDRLLADGSLVVGWLLRGTLHLVPAEDYWWLHTLTAPTRLTTNRRRLGQEGVSSGDARRALEIVERVLAADGPRKPPQQAERHKRAGHSAGGPATPPQLMLAPHRGVLAERLSRAGIRAEGQATHHLLMLAALRGVAVLGPPRGDRQAFVLAREWLGPVRTVDRSTALGELARRYLAGHAPAAPEDLARWSGLPLRDVRRLPSASFDDVAASPPPRLLPAFDPYLLGWKDRSFAVPAKRARQVHPGGGVLRAVATVGGEAAGTWRLRGGQVELEPFSPLRPEDEAALAAEAEDVARFLGC